MHAWQFGDFMIVGANVRLVNGPLCMIVGATDCEYFFFNYFFEYTKLINQRRVH